MPIYIYKLENRIGEVVMETYDRQDALRSLGEDGSPGDRLYRENLDAHARELLAAYDRESYNHEPATA